MARVELFNPFPSLIIRKCPFLLNEIWHFSPYLLFLELTIT